MLHNSTVSSYSRSFVESETFTWLHDDIVSEQGQKGSLAPGKTCPPAAQKLISCTGWLEGWEF